MKMNKANGNISVRFVVFKLFSSHVRKYFLTYFRLEITNYYESSRN
jgi:hypothetical protein